MNTKKKRFAPKKRLIKHFLSLTLAGSLLLPGLVLIHSEPVEANIITDMAGGVVGKLRYNATVAELIVSLLAGSGAGVTDTNYLNQINQSYGIESTIALATGTDGTIGAMMDAGLFSIADDGTFIDNGLVNAIESQPAYTNCNIDSILGTWNDAGTEITQAASENLGTSIGAAAAVGTISQVAGAFLAGFNLGNVAVNFVKQYGAKMSAQTAISSSNYANVGEISCGGTYKNGNFSNYYGPIGKCVFAVITNNGTYNQGAVLNFSNENITIRNYRNSGWTSFSLSSKDVAAAPSSNSTNTWQPVNGYEMAFNTYNDAREYLNNTTDWSNYDPQSPDVVGPAGNQKINQNFDQPQNVQNWPNMGQQTPEGKGMNVIPWDDYMDWVNDANINYNNYVRNVQQGDTYNNFIENYFVTPEVTVNPDINNPGINNPTIETVTSPNYDPTVPEQPTPNPKEELTSEQIQDTTDYMTTPGLKDVFPFSIPWDIAGLFNVFSTNNRAAPVITFPIKSNLFGIDEEVTIDFSVYDDIASLLRLLELIAFGVGLAFVTRYLIGAGG